MDPAHRRWHGSALVALVALNAAALTAQSRSLAAFADSLDHIREAPVLESMLAQRLSSDGQGARLERGLLYARLFELTRDDEQISRARAVFDSARRAGPDDPLAHWGYALALARGPNVRSDAILAATGRSWSSQLGLDDRARALRAVDRALDLEPGLDRAAALLAELALQTRSRSHLQRAYDILVAQLAGGGRSDAALLMLSRTADALGDREAAILAAEELAGRPDPSPEALYTLMTALLRTPGREEAGERVWSAVLDRLTPRLADRIFSELRPIASRAEQLRWDDADLTGRRDLLRGFWNVRAGLSAVSVGERMASHYQRLAVALDRYVRGAVEPPPPHTLTGEAPEGVFDERGIIYLRHGEPYRRIRTRVQPLSSTCAMSIALVRDSVDGSHASPTEPTEDNESWVYADEDGRYRTYHFLKCRGYPDWVLPYDIPCDRSRIREWVMARAAYDVDTQHCASRTRDRIRTEARQALSSDSHRPRFDGTLPFGYDLFAFRGEHGATDLSAPIAIQADSLRVDTLSDGNLGHALDIALHVVDTIGNRAFRADTLVAFRTNGSPTTGGVIVTHVDLGVPALDDAVQRIMVREANRSPGRGRMHGQRIRIPDFSGDSLLISTVVLGLLEGAPNWRRGEVTLPVVPMGEFRGGDFRVFYEIYNLSDDAPFRTEITIHRVPRGDRDITGFLTDSNPVVRLRFDDRATPDAAGIVRQLRTVESELEPGIYRIRVSVLDLEGGGRSFTERQFAVVEE